MSTTEYRWTPTTSSVEKKNTKFRLASAVIDVWRAVEECKDEETKNKIIRILLGVL